MENPKIGKKSIFRKLLFIILIVFLTELALFAFSLSFATERLVNEVTNIRLEDYLKTAQLLDDPSGVTEETPGHNIESIVFSIYETEDPEVSEGANKLLSETEIKHIINEASTVSFLDYKHGTIEHGSTRIYYAYTATQYDTIVIALCSDDYLNESIMDLIIIVVILYTLIFLIAAIITLVWARLLVKRLNKLCTFVNDMPGKEYKDMYIDDGKDELYNLSVQIDHMRQTILKDEATKQAMLQNVSHDLKTPIAVIKSYTEAIEDGVEDVKATQIIIEQCNKLEKKVKNFIEFNRLEFLNSDIKEEVLMKPIIQKIVTNHKHLLHVDIVEDLDDTIFIGRYENYFTVCENLIENALRYAVSVVKITIKNGVLTVYNDGKHIDEKFVLEGFKPYEKGSEGKFGLGMSIVCRTLDIFNMKLSVKNEEVGVIFRVESK